MYKIYNNCHKVCKVYYRWISITIGQFECVSAAIFVECHLLHNIFRSKLNSLLKVQRWARIQSQSLSCESSQ